jgi:hypothetical protein
VTPLDTPTAAALEPPLQGSRRRLVWHAIAVLLAAIVAWLVFTAYRQPDLMIDLAGMRLCASAAWTGVG